MFKFICLRDFTFIKQLINTNYTKSVLVINGKKAHWKLQELIQLWAFSNIIVFDALQENMRGQRGTLRGVGCDMS